MAFKFEQLEIPGVIHIVPDVYPDDRGAFCEVYKEPEFKKAGLTKPLVQINHSKSVKGALRGLHYQKDPKAQAKLVTVVEGEIFDVAVDVRQGSPTYGKWVSSILNAGQRNLLYVPEGFAHGFCVLSPTAQVIYCCTELYSPQDERGIIWNDPDLHIDWPIKQPVLSEKDKELPLFKEADNNFRY